MLSPETSTPFLPKPSSVNKVQKIKRSKNGRWQISCRHKTNNKSCDCSKLVKYQKPADMAHRLAVKAYVYKIIEVNLIKKYCNLKS